MMAMPENPPAFPCEAQGDRSVPPEHDYIQTGIYTAKFPGMSLRDWMAGQALPGVLSAPRDTVYGYVVEHCGSDKLPPQQVAQLAYEIADAMLSARQTTDREDGK